MAIWSAIFWTTSCVIPDDLLDERTCPCGEGWYCSSERICVRNDDNTNPPAVEATCWQAPLGCDWSQPGTFTFEEDEGSVFPFPGRAANFIFSPDGCTVFYNRETDNAIHIYEVSRTSGEPFGSEIRTPGVGSDGTHEGKASVSADGLTLYYSASAFGAGGDDAEVFMSTRESRMESWQGQTQVDALSAPGLATFDVFVAPHGLRAYFSRTTFTEDQDLLVAERPHSGAPFGQPRIVEEVSQGLLGESEPVVSANGRVMTYVAIPAVGAARQLYYATRNSWQDEWEPQGPVPGTFFSAGDEFEGAISPDACEILARGSEGYRRLVYRATP